MQKKYGFVYIWYDRKHKRYYIGCHWGTENDGYICSSTWMKQAYRIRPHDFKRRILKSNILNRTDMYLEEQRYLNMIKFKEIKIRYYNLRTTCNETWLKYPEHIKTIGQKISASKKGKSIGPCSEETKRKISKSNTGKVRTKETKEKLRQAKLGYKHTEEWKLQNSIKLKEQWASGKRKVKETHTEETKLKMSAAHKGKIMSENQKQLLKLYNSKEYKIYYNNGTCETIKGLKQYGLNNGIPYITLHKSYLLKRPINKYNIQLIE